MKPNVHLGKPKNTGVGSPTVLQGNFLTQEKNQGLLHCRWILKQLSYQESPKYPLRKRQKFYADRLRKINDTIICWKYELKI